MLKARNRRNAIVSIKLENDTVEGVSQVKKGFKNHFVNRFKVEKMNRQKLDNLEFKTLSAEDIMGLEEMFTKE